MYMDQCISACDPGSVDFMDFNSLKPGAKSRAALYSRHAAAFYEKRRDELNQIFLSEGVDAVQGPQF